MAFKGLADRFEARVAEVYVNQPSSFYSGDQPYLEFKPTDPNRNETANDSRILPIGSIKRDTIRLGKFLKSGNGLLFLGQQQLLQTGNVFAETRLLNPLFVFGNVTPYLHVGRDLRSAKDFLFSDVEGISPVSLDVNVGHAGRMQKETKSAAIARVTGKTGVSGLLGLLNISNVVKTISGAFGIGTGATG